MQAGTKRKLAHLVLGSVFAIVGIIGITGGTQRGVSHTTSLAAASNVPQLMFGMGSEANAARTTQPATQAPVKMLTSWYNGPNDLTWLSNWQYDEVPNDYAAGYALHLVV